MKPPVEIEQFQKLDLRVGTVTAIQPHPSVASLSILTVLLDEPVEILAPASLTAGKAVGVRVVVAASLYPLSAGGLRFTRCLAPMTGPGGAVTSPAITTRVPDGSRLS